MGKKSEVLIGDDNEDVLFAYEIMLKDRAKIVKTPEAFLQHVREAVFSVFITDLNYTRGGEEGFLILEELKELPGRKVLCTSDANNPDVRKRAEQLGAEVISKLEMMPFLDELIASLQKETKEKVSEITE